MQNIGECVCVTGVGVQVGVCVTGVGAQSTGESDRGWGAEYRWV